MKTLNHRINPKTINQSGYAAIEMIVVLILVISALGFGAQAMFDHAEAVAGAECNTVIELKLEHHAA